jgi:hypothetical protein
MIDARVFDQLAVYEANSFCGLETEPFSLYVWPTVKRRTAYPENKTST